MEARTMMENNYKEAILRDLALAIDGLQNISGFEINRKLVDNFICHDFKRGGKTIMSVKYDREMVGDDWSWSEMVQLRLSCRALAEQLTQDAVKAALAREYIYP